MIRPSETIQADYYYKKKCFGQWTQNGAFIRDELILRRHQPISHVIPVYMRIYNVLIVIPM